MLGLFFISCDKEDECHPCHIAYHLEHEDECCGDATAETCCSDEEGEHDHEEIEVEIGEFCGDDLEAVEADGYVHTLTESKEVTHDGETIVIPAGNYSEVHCEEHAH